MSKVAKQIIIILVLLLIVSAFMAVSIMNQKVSLEQNNIDLEEQLVQSENQETKLMQEKQDLDRMLQEAQSAREKVQQQKNEMEALVSQITQERDDWQGRVGALRKERDELMVKLQEKPKEIIIEREPEGKEPVQVERFVAGEEEDEYWAQVLKEKAALKLQLEDVRSELSGAIIEIEELKKKNSDFDLEISLLKREKEDVERKIKYSEDLANNLSVELAREKNDKRYVSNKFEKLREENLSLRSHVKELSTAKITLEKSISRLKEDKEKIAQRLSETESVIQNRIDEVLEIKTSLDSKLRPIAASAAAKEVELAPIIVSASSSGFASSLQGGLKPGLNGRVVSVNEENNFVILDLGEGAGIRVGDRLSIFRSSQYIAGIEVIQVRKDISAADIKQQGARIKVGDVVR